MTFVKESTNVVTVTVKDKTMFCDREDWLKYCLILGKALRISKAGYVVFGGGRNQQVKLFHRWLLDFPNSEIDHINGNSLDNRRCNLRLVTHLQNHRNLNSKIRIDNTSGVRGVHWQRRSQKWVAQITLNSKVINLGSFICKEHAIEARRLAEIKNNFTRLEVPNVC